MVSVQDLHTFGLRSQTRSLISLNDYANIPHVLSILRDNHFMLLGEGSNTIFLENYTGLIVKNNLLGVSFKQCDDFYYIRASSGENWHYLVQQCMQRQIYGFENLALIPGTVGAAPIQNIGAYGVEVEQFIESVDVVDIQSGNEYSLLRDECQFGYRDSIFKRKLQNKVIILAVHFALPKQYELKCSYGPLTSLQQKTPEAVYNKVVEVRSEKLPDPKKVGNAGSFFKNPVITRHQFALIERRYPNPPCYQVDDEHVKVPAAWLIDTLGFKGKTIGNIQCHKLQPLVLINLGAGTGKELLKLAREIKSSVLREFDINLENEVRLIGETGLVEL